MPLRVATNDCILYTESSRALQHRSIDWSPAVMSRRCIASTMSSLSCQQSLYLHHRESPDSEVTRASVHLPIKLLQWVGPCLYVLSFVNPVCFLSAAVRIANFCLAVLRRARTVLLRKVVHPSVTLRYCAERLKTLENRREELAKRFFRCNVLDETSCLHYRPIYSSHRNAHRKGPRYAIALLTNLRTLFCANWKI